MIEGVDGHPEEEVEAEGMKIEAGMGIETTEIVGEGGHPGGAEATEAEEEAEGGLQEAEGAEAVGLLVVAEEATSGGVGVAHLAKTTGDVDRLY
mmetsp:Transcript_25390/g.12043  ORF Transcript_25390/g.12043 Transcript_25390/m.12043 type:complete len:94 (-) Transcript_25390:12-293(-)|eukprot:CAMPEP_0201281334 /NCGR_PEP_ID=MMETSP1317-20130820/2449_1 /ASSEMBLY_ACC=CAM_ASM_000770 /TAXON_ID=187299 /ORGANISM="Undescribed Undescribed, Strain Undescribed" /LENGTH=93 /DNA_ID=CAMNT_0047590941 /DNA_START=242 /DNA_END=523 /DNA_ORIENTATION=-